MSTNDRLCLIAMAILIVVLAVLLAFDFAGIDLVTKMLGEQP